MPPTLSIAAVERDTGLSKDTLRMWERRYGFPAPTRDGAGERSYPTDQIAKLRLIKGLLDAGHCPGRVIGLSESELRRLSQGGPALTTAFDTTTVQQYLDLLTRQDSAALRRELGMSLSRLGPAGFVSEVAGPLITAVGDGWLRGHLQVYQEHLFTEVMQGLLRRAIADVPAPSHVGRPQVLLATLVGEPHGLGLLMAEALLAQAGCHCTSLGTQIPVWDAAMAAQALDADIVALSFTGCTGPTQVQQNLTDLRARLAPGVALWAGGSAPVLQRCQVSGVKPLPTLAAVPAEVQRWRNQHLFATSVGAVPKMQA